MVKLGYFGQVLETGSREDEGTESITLMMVNTGSVCLLLPPVQGPGRQGRATGIGMAGVLVALLGRSAGGRAFLSAGGG